MKAFKRHRDYGFFDQDIRLSKLSKLGDPLEKLNQGVDFELFRQVLDDGFEKVAKGKRTGCRIRYTAFAEESSISSLP